MDGESYLCMSIQGSAYFYPLNVTNLIKISRFVEKSAIQCLLVVKIEKPTLDGILKLFITKSKILV